MLWLLCDEFRESSLFFPIMGFIDILYGNCFIIMLISDFTSISEDIDCLACVPMFSGSKSRHKRNYTIVDYPWFESLNSTFENLCKLSRIVRWKHHIGMLKT